jgi:hypothetical protein
MTNPPMPDQAKNQAISAARAIVAALGLSVTQAWVSLSSCNDQGEAPFRGQVTMHYPTGRTVADARAQIQSYLSTLYAAGWQPHPHEAGYVEKDGVTAIFHAPGPADTVQVITVLGQCRDTFTTKASRGGDEPLHLSRSEHRP